MSRLLTLVLLILGATAPLPAGAIMAGAPPDSPALRQVPESQLANWPGLGQVTTAHGRFAGVAVSRWHVLTATHVAGGMNTSPESIRFIPATDPAATREVVRVQRLPGYAMPANDLAVLTLSAPLPTHIGIATLLARPLAAGEAIDLIGPGHSGHGDTGPRPQDAPPSYRWGRNVADLVGEHVPGVGAPGHFLFYDFDGPTGHGVVGGPTLGNAIETLVASGDSGAPIYWRDERAQIRRLVGISTAVISPAPGQGPRFTFGSMGVGTDLTAAPVRAWLTSVTEGQIEQAGGVASGAEGRPVWRSPAAIATLGLGVAVLALGTGAMIRRSQRSRRDG